MELSKDEDFKLRMLTKQLGDLPLHEAAQHYKQYTQIYLSLEQGDIAELRFIQDKTQLSNYGNLLTKSQCNDENLMDYEVEVHARRSHIHGMTQSQREDLVKEIGRACFANVYKPTAGKRLFDDVIYLLPLVHPADKTEHTLIKAFFQEYGMTYRRTHAQFTYAIK